LAAAEENTSEAKKGNGYKGGNANRKEKHLLPLVLVLAHGKERERTKKQREISGHKID
jgi:hypothetical protein